MYPHRIIPITSKPARSVWTPAMIAAARQWLCRLPAKLPAEDVPACRYPVLWWGSRMHLLPAWLLPHGMWLARPHAQVLTSYAATEITPPTGRGQSASLDIEWPSEVPPAPPSDPPVAAPTSDPVIVVGSMLDLFT